MMQDTNPAVTYRFTFVGPGVGLGLLPVGLDFSVAKFPSFGTRLWKPNPLLGKTPPLAPNDLVLLPTIVLSIGANVGPGWSGTAVFWGTHLLQVAS